MINAGHTTTIGATMPRMPKSAAIAAASKVIAVGGPWTSIINTSSYARM